MEPTQSILTEAHTLVHGDRGESYGHPLDDFSRTASAASALLADKLLAPLSAEDVAVIMVCVKLSREQNHPKRDNRVDAAGYVETLDMVIEERRRRASLPHDQLADAEAAAAFGDYMNKDRAGDAYRAWLAGMKRVYLARHAGTS